MGDLAHLLSGLFRALASGFGDPSYELVLHNVPNLRSRVMKGDWATIQDDYHWHIEVLTHLERINRVGGIYVNELPPEIGGGVPSRRLGRREAPLRDRGRGP